MVKRSIALCLATLPAATFAQDVLITKPHAEAPPPASERALRCARRDEPVAGEDRLVRGAPTGLRARTMLCLAPESIAALRTGTLNERQMAARLRQRIARQEGLSDAERREAEARLNDLAR